MSGNLPPGVNNADIDRHFGGPSHEHEWELAQRENPLLEDLAAIFTEKCRWVEILGSFTSEKYDETFYEEGAECDARRRYRFELAYIKKLTDGEPDVTFYRSVIDFYQRVDDETWDWLMDIIRDVELSHYHGHDEIDVVSCDPDRNTGEFVVRYNDAFEVGYGPGVHDGRVIDDE